MNGSLPINHERLVGMKRLKATQQVQVVICPAFIHLMQVRDFIAQEGLDWALGAQNLALQSEGSLTGEISSTMLKELGVQYVIVGHSERRELCGETPDVLGLKLFMALQAGLIPIYCIRDLKDLEFMLFYLEKHSDQGFKLSERFLIIAYEPVWAIGTGQTPTVADLTSVQTSIRGLLAQKGLISAAVVYGGSLNALNAASLLNAEGIAGGLVGGAALNPLEFNRIVESI